VRPSFEELPLLLRCASAGIFFINPYKKFASSPIKLGEFLACGRPVIINSGIGDTEELVTENKVGVVVKNFSREEYSKRIGELLELLKEGNSLEKRCRTTAERYLSLAMGAGRYLNIYNRF
jgi:glycosyltransferase involved in cell wall biosynthesis